MNRVVWNGLTISDATPNSLPSWITEEIPSGAPGVVAASGQRVQRDGEWRTTAYSAGMTGPLSGVCEASTVEEAAQLQRDLMGAASINLGVLTVHDVLGPRTLFVARDAELSINNVRPGVFRWSTVLTAPDPVWWLGDQTLDLGVDDSALVTRSTGLPLKTGGFMFPVMFPAAFDEQGDTGDVRINFTTNARVTFRIEGPVVDPSILVSRGNVSQTLEWRIQLSAGEWLEVDPYSRTALLQGQSVRVPWRREWPTFTAEPTTISFRADTYTAAARLVINIRPLW